jgi:hypothetical protein
MRSTMQWPSEGGQAAPRGSYRKAHTFKLPAATYLGIK